MHVRKFEADTMNEAFKKIKQELGPDAIILKTITNKGLKGAFKKKKIEITAAISEKNYIKKAKVDTVLDKGQKQKFYNHDSSYISKVINTYSAKPNPPPEVPPLEEFLQDSPSQGELSLQKKRIDELEKTIFELKKNLHVSSESPQGIFQLRTLLQSVGINESSIQEICKTALFEFSKEELNEQNLIFEFALREMLKKIKIALPLFGSLDHSKTVTVLLSKVSCGQTAMLFKLGALKKKHLLIRKKGPTSFAEDLLNLNIEQADSIPEYVAATRKGVESDHCVFLDYKCCEREIEETKRLIDGLRRSFSQVEVLLCLSAIHSENYNKNLIHSYHFLSDGLIVTHLDLCLNYGSLFNIGCEYKDLPFKFFSTGPTIPEDIETASAERILDGIFHLEKSTE